MSRQALRYDTGKQQLTLDTAASPANLVGFLRPQRTDENGAPGRQTRTSKIHIVELADSSPQKLFDLGRISRCLIGGNVRGLRHCFLALLRVLIISLHFCVHT